MAGDRGTLSLLTDQCRAWARPSLSSLALRLNRLQLGVKYVEVGHVDVRSEPMASYDAQKVGGQPCSTPGPPPPTMALQ